MSKRSKRMDAFRPKGTKQRAASAFVTGCDMESAVRRRTGSNGRRWAPPGEEVIYRGSAPYSRLDTA